MRKKWFGLLAAGVLLVSCMMTGCGSKTSEPPAASGAETAAGAQAGAERGTETVTEAGTARQAQAQPGCPPLISPATL